jgi:hypothetical protein
MANKKELEQYEENLKKYEEQLLDAQKRLESEKMEMTQYSSQLYPNGAKQNLVEWELDFKPELDDIARSLRCDILVMDEKGNQYWTRNPNPDRIFLNELGVNDVLRKIILLVNKNKVLSNYTIEEIRLRVRQIGHEIRALIYNNYEAYGIDNEYKMNNYPGIVMDILDIIEGAYRRALAGETHKGLAEQRLVTQSDSLNSQPMQFIRQNKVAKWYNPTTWTA